MENDNNIRNAKEYCNDTYRRLFNEEYQRLTTIEDEIKKARTAQKAAIRRTLYLAIRRFPNIDSTLLWEAIYGAHVHRLTNIDDTTIIESVISAAQSWRKSSGHAFEEFIKDNVTKALRGTSMKVVLQRDLSQMIHEESLGNSTRDIEWLNERLDLATFDLYILIKPRRRKWQCFGCIQSKTSIRDRVTRDREPSIAAMALGFWSVCITLDGEFLNLPKFKGMVNGGNAEYPTNGWHGMYVLSNIEHEDRIYPVDLSFSLFKRHALEAVRAWSEQRVWFRQDWRATEE